MDLETQLLEHPARDALEEARVLARLQARMFGRAPMPVRLGHYELIRPLGAGAAGVVYLAHDPKLQRQVAIKILQQQSEDGRARQRLVREAHILARLSHPNVVAVYDVGTVGERVYVVMEFVDGLPLDQWVKARQCGWREIVRLFRAAGEGLAAVHRSGMLHRDFKPSNVIVDREGRAKLADFGLARVTSSQPTAGDSEASAGGPSNEAVSGPSGATPHDGLGSRSDGSGFVGTPAYMAPEQFAGHCADTLTDQFAFCVALHEALYGQRPFVGGSPDSLVAAATAGPAALRARTRDGVRVPRWLRRILLTGLSPRRDERWGSMDALLVALASGAARVRRTWISLGAGGLALAFGSVPVRAELQRDRLVSQCESEGAAVYETGWNEGNAERLRSALQQSSQGDEAFARLQPFAKSFADEWQRERTRVCIGASVEKTWDADLALRAKECFDEHREGFAALLEVLAHAQPSMHLHAVPAILSLPRPSTCSDKNAVSRWPLPPDDPAVRARARELRASLLEVTGLSLLGNSKDAYARAEDVRARAEELGLLWLQLRAEVMLAKLGRELGDAAAAESHDRHALVEAGAAGFDDVAADAAAGLLTTLASHLARYDEAMAFGDVATMIVRRLEADEGMRSAQLYTALGEAQGKRGKYEEAEALHHRAVAIAEANLGPDHPKMFGFLNNLAGSHYRRGNYDDAAASFSRALELAEEALGPEHPDVLVVLNNLSAIEQHRGNYDEALRLSRRVLDTRRRTLGADHPQTTTTLANLGILHQLRGEYDEAERLLEDALEIRNRVLGPAHPDTANAAYNLALFHLMRGKNELARTQLRQVVTIREEALGPEHSKLAEALEMLARVTADPDEATKLARRALQIYEVALGPEHLKIGSCHQSLATAARARGDVREASQHERRALAVIERQLGPHHHDVGASLAWLANDLIIQGDHDEAQALLERASKIFETTRGDDHPDRGIPIQLLGELALARGRPAEAIPLLERALVLREHASNPASMAAIQFALAKALWATRSDRARALSLARTAAAAFEAVGENSREQLVEAQRWLRKHRL